MHSSTSSGSRPTTPTITSSSSLQTSPPLSSRVRVDGVVGNGSEAGPPSTVGSLSRRGSFVAPPGPGYRIGDVGLLQEIIVV